MSRILLRLGGPGAIMLLATTAALGQTPAAHQGHENHQAAPAPGAVARVMPDQPRLDGVELVDHRGRRMRLDEAVETDEPVLVNFIFTTCTTICPVMTTGFAQFQEALGDERDRVRLVSISIDPDTDTVDTLRGYAERYHADGSWSFLTGSPEAVVAAQRAFGAYRGNKINHTAATYLRRAPGSPWEIVDGLSSAETLLRAYRGHGDPHQP